MKSYINSLNNYGLEIKEWQVDKLLKLLGIEVRTQFVINSDHKFKDIQQHLKEKYGYHWTEQEKRVSSSAEGGDNIFD